MDSFEKIVKFLDIAVHLGWVNSNYNDINGVGYFLENPQKWKSEYDFMVKWTLTNFGHLNFFIIIDECLEDVFLGAYHLWVNGRGE